MLSDTVGGYFQRVDERLSNGFTLLSAVFPHFPDQRCGKVNDVQRHERLLLGIRSLVHNDTILSKCYEPS